MSSLEGPTHRFILVMDSDRQNHVNCIFCLNWFIYLPFPLPKSFWSTNKTTSATTIDYTTFIFPCLRFISESPMKSAEQNIHEKAWGRQRGGLEVVGNRKGVIHSPWVSQCDGAMCKNSSRQCGHSIVENKTTEICKMYLFFTPGCKACERCNL